MKIKKKMLIVFLGLVFVFGLVSIGVSYAVFNYTKKGSVSNKITTGTNEIVLKDEILKNNTLIEAEPTLTTSSNNTSDASGLYKSTDTNSGNPTYYFRGNVENNYVSFAGQTWRIVRINEDGTVRLIMQDGINSNTVYTFNTSANNYTYMYYSNSEVKTTLDSWYTSNLASHSNKIKTGDYFCEEAKVKSTSGYTSGSATMTVYTSYIPNFKCSTDGNDNGVINDSVGLITYDEAVYAGAYYNQSNSSYYLNNETYFWTMSSAGVYSNNYAYAWRVDSSGRLNDYYIHYTGTIRPVINLKANIPVTGSGLIGDPYVVQS